MRRAVRLRVITGVCVGVLVIAALSLAGVWGYSTFRERSLALGRLAEARDAEAHMRALVAVGKDLEAPWERLRMLAVEASDVDTGRRRVEQVIRDAAERTGVELVGFRTEVAAQPPPGGAGVVVSAHLRFVGTSAQAVNCSYLLEYLRAPAFWFDRVRWSATGDRRRIEVALELRAVVIPIVEAAG